MKYVLFIFLNRVLLLSTKLHLYFSFAFLAIVLQSSNCFGGCKNGSLARILRLQMSATMKLDHPPQQSQLFGVILVTDEPTEGQTNGKRAWNNLSNPGVLYTTYFLIVG